MDTGQLDAFLTVARTGRLGPAARELHVTQPALTARIRRLEQAVGGTLFVRSRRGMRLSQAGRVFLPFAERALESLEEGSRLASDVAGAGHGVLVLAAPPAVSAYVLPDLLAQFTRAHPEVELSVRTGHSEEVLQLVLDEQVQLGLTRELQHPEVTATAVYEDALVLVAPPGHPFAGRDAVAMAEVAEERLILFDQRSSYHELTASLFRGAGLRPRAVMELDSSGAAARMVEHGLGVSLLPASAVRALVDQGTLVEVKLADAPRVRRRIIAIHRSDVPPPPPARALLALMVADKARRG
jgi:DNA-binding transcriptional LysR family regulator